MWIFGEHVYFEQKAIVRAYKFSELQEAFCKIERYAKKHYALGYVAYEAWYESFDLDSISSAQDTSDSKQLPLLEFYIFSKRKKLDYLESKHEKISQPFAFEILQNLDFSRYKSDFARIKNELKVGNTYQINYTQEMRLFTRAKPLDVFFSLKKRQNTRYKAFFNTKYAQILSFSPELFFKLKNGSITLEPMKGTILRAKDKAQDKKNKEFLHRDSKNISENMMIVDLLRNDISQIARVGSLRVKKLLKIRPLKTLYQMVSILKAQVDSTQDLSQIFSIFNALFPCGSITGAPKKSTMHKIQMLESRTRGVYCGAIGLVHKKKACFNVPIRTLVRYKYEEFYRYGVGSGVVWDSVMEEEFKELRVKSRFLFSATPTNTESNQPKNVETLQDDTNNEIALFETFLVKYENNAFRVFLGAYHWQRLLQSARKLFSDFDNFTQNPTRAFLSEIKHIAKPYVSNHIAQAMRVKFLKSCLMENKNLSPLQIPFAWDFMPQSLDNMLKKHFTHMPAPVFIVKLILTQNGALSLQVRDFTPSTLQNTAYLSHTRQDSHNDFLYHKTTQRAHFEKQEHFKNVDSALFDVLYCNEFGALTEGARSNIILLQGKKLVTPSLESGLLPGCMRAFLLDCGILSEEYLSKKNLKRTQSIFLCNSVRGIVRVNLKKSRGRGKKR
ncbi:bifunctional chorismate-binding protein/class IV aminotransferase [Helicobacter himalayensis]|uniref:bifunctional chorismate-binding protein/class IV aminotransferase n=1 Tax=Helicobacter himalayensis TaxID=1591088 RepID=UPI00082A0C52|nr:bifunctional anthranilate synthase component I family protein/class IV aminotransferase [Helicobacter himalayensis]